MKKETPDKRQEASDALDKLGQAVREEIINPILDFMEEYPVTFFWLVVGYVILVVMLIIVTGGYQ